MYNRNDGIYVVVNGIEYMLEDTTPFDNGGKCDQCDLRKNRQCVAPSWCLKIENEFQDSYWKETTASLVEKDVENDKHLDYYMVNDDTLPVALTFNNEKSDMITITL